MYPASGDRKVKNGSSHDPGIPSFQGNPISTVCDNQGTRRRSCVDNVQSSTFPSINRQLGGQHKSDRHGAR